jgi:hypothetical protein
MLVRLDGDEAVDAHVFCLADAVGAGHGLQSVQIRIV